MRVCDDDFDKITHTQTHVGTNQRAERHDGGRTSFFQLTGCDRVREHVGHDHEAFLGQHFSGTNGFGVVRQKVLGFMLDFDLDEISVAYFAGQSRNTHGLLGIARARSIRQQRNALRNVIKHAVLGGLRATQCHGDNLRTGVLDRGLDEVQVIAAGTQDESRLEFVASQIQRLVFHRQNRRSGTDRIGDGGLRRQRRRLNGCFSNRIDIAHSSSFQPP